MGRSPVIAVARDEAFHFTYEDNLDLLRAAGAEIAFFSPLRDAALPAETASIILSGGFPEVYAGQLAANRALHAALRTAHRQGLPIYAECGGLMYLTQAIVAGGQGQHEMIGLLPGRCVMSGRLTLGYRLARSAGSSWFLSEGETVRGHEFHYSTWEGRPDDLPPAYSLLPRSGTGLARPEGDQVGNLWASYVHVHLGARPGTRRAFRRSGERNQHTEGRREAVKSLDIGPDLARKRGMVPEPRREVLDLPSAVHGSLDFVELRTLGLHPEDVLDFSANLNPYAPSPAVPVALAGVSLGQYPDRESLALRAALAESLGVAAERILPGNGASELIWLAALAFVRPGSQVLVLGPTYCEYARAAGLMGAIVSTWRRGRKPALSSTRWRLRAA